MRAVSMTMSTDSKWQKDYFLFKFKSLLLEFTYIFVSKTACSVTPLITNATQNNRPLTCLRNASVQQQIAMQSGKMLNKINSVCIRQKVLQSLLTLQNVLNA